MERIPRVNTFRAASNVYGMQPRSSSLAITHTRVKDLQALNVLDSDEQQGIVSARVFVRRAKKKPNASFVVIVYP